MAERVVTAHQRLQLLTATATGRMEHGVGTTAVGAQMQLEEVLPRGDAASFFLQNIYFSYPGVAAPGFCLVAPRTGIAAVWGCGHHQEGHQMAPRGSGKQPGRGILEELLWQRGSQQLCVQSLPGPSHATRRCLFGSLYLTVLPAGCSPRPQQCEVVDTSHHLETSTAQPWNEWS